MFCAIHSFPPYYRPTWWCTGFSFGVYYFSHQTKGLAKRSAASDQRPPPRPRRSCLHVTASRLPPPPRPPPAASDGGGVSGAWLPRFGFGNHSPAPFLSFHFTLCSHPSIESPFPPFVFGPARVDVGLPIRACWDSVLAAIVALWTLICAV